jgi:uncharacterized protein YoxC
MDTLLQSQVFFFISSIGFVVLWIMVAVLVFYLIRASKTFDRIIGKIERNIDEIGDTTKDMLEDMRDSTIFNFLFRKKKKRSK